MIKVLVAAVVGLVVGIAVMIFVIVNNGTTTSDSSSIGLTLSVSTATAPGATTTPSTSGGSSGGDTTGGGTSTGGSADGGGDATAGKAVFMGSSGCAGCHTFKAAGSTGTIGPDLDNLSTDDSDDGGMPLSDFVHESIVDPDKYIAKGYNAGIMPGTFGTSLSETDLANLVAFIVDNQTS